MINSFTNFILFALHSNSHEKVCHSYFVGHWPLRRWAMKNNNNNKITSNGKRTIDFVRTGGGSSQLLMTIPLFSHILVKLTSSFRVTAFTIMLIQHSAQAQYSVLLIHFYRESNLRLSMVCLILSSGLCVCDLWCV